MTVFTTTTNIMKNINFRGLLISLVLILSIIGVIVGTIFISIDLLITADTVVKYTLADFRGPAIMFISVASFIISANIKVKQLFSIVIV